MLPLLRLLADEKPRRIRELTESLADAYELTDEERREMLPSGKQTTFTNRVGWARTYMGKAGLLETVSRGTVRITPRGQETLRTQPDRIDRAFLMGFDSFRAFQQPVAVRQATANPPSRTSEDAEESRDPGERLDAAYREIRAAL